MGQISSKLLFPTHMVLETFIVKYMSEKGPTPYTMNLLPGGSIKPEDSESVVRHKFRMARKQQKVLRNALLRSSNSHSLSPCLITDFDLHEESDNNNGSFYTFIYEGEDEDESSRAKTTRTYSNLGTLNKLVSFSSQYSSEEIVAFQVKKQAGGDQDKAGKQKRSRSRPEPPSRRRENAERQAKSSTEVRRSELPSIQECQSEVIIEKIQLGKKKLRKSWPPRDIVRNVMKDPSKRPTTYFLGRFRKSPTQDYIEVDYRFNQKTGEEQFNVEGPLETLLSPDARIRYQVDKINNNLDNKVVFLESLCYFLNNHEGRIWWNGYLITIDSAAESRIQVDSIEMKNPAIHLNMTGIQFVNACRELQMLSVNGCNEEGAEPERTFSIKAKTENDVKQISLTHEPGTVLINIGLPLLSGVPTSTNILKVSQSRVAQVTTDTDTGTGTKMDEEEEGEEEVEQQA